MRTYEILIKCWDGTTFGICNIIAIGPKTAYNRNYDSFPAHFKKDVIIRVVSQ
jgi:hypothetical protein